MFSASNGMATFFSPTPRKPPTPTTTAWTLPSLPISTSLMSPILTVIRAVDAGADQLGRAPVGRLLLLDEAVLVRSARCSYAGAASSALPAYRRRRTLRERRRGERRGKRGNGQSMFEHRVLLMNCVLKAAHANARHLKANARACRRVPNMKEF